MYAHYFMHDRNNTNSIIHYGGRLYQEWMVDQYCKAEELRLSYLRKHQATLRAEVYQGLADSVHRGDGTDVAGRLVVLPASFVGGARFMAQCYQDSMALVRKYGKPTLFITMTCNPNWVEITRELAGQAPNDRPDVIARVFRMKLKVRVCWQLQCESCVYVWGTSCGVGTCY
jgi:hypothetical protein